MDAVGERYQGVGGASKRRICIKVEKEGQGGGRLSKMEAVCQGVEEMSMSVLGCQGLATAVKERGGQGRRECQGGRRDVKDKERGVKERGIC